MAINTRKTYISTDAYWTSGTLAADASSISFLSFSSLALKMHTNL